MVIRARDEAASIGRLLDLLAEQDEPHEVIVVDSGSTDATVAIARERGASVVHVAPAEFSFGGALNRGAAEGSAPVVVALSAHAFPRDSAWLRRIADTFEDSAVCCAFGAERGPDGVPLQEPIRQDEALARAHPRWGYSNGAGAFRRALWEQRGFRADMPGTEDREWALWALAHTGGVCVLDPALAVDHDHEHDDLRTAFTRFAREERGYRMFLQEPPYGLGDAAREWWTERGWYRSAWRARLDPRRVARLAGKWWGARG